MFGVLVFFTTPTNGKLLASRIVTLFGRKGTNGFVRWDTLLRTLTLYREVGISLPFLGNGGEGRESMDLCRESPGYLKKSCRVEKGGKSVWGFPPRYMGEKMFCSVLFWCPPIENIWSQKS